VRGGVSRRKRRNPYENENPGGYSIYGEYITIAEPRAAGRWQAGSEEKVKPRTAARPANRALL